MHSCRRFGVSFQKVSPFWWGRRFRLPGLFLILKWQAKPPAPPKPPGRSRVASFFSTTQNLQHHAAHEELGRAPLALRCPARGDRPTQLIRLAVAFFNSALVFGA